MPKALSIQEENEQLRALLRENAPTHPTPTKALAAWWSDEQKMIEDEEAREDAKRAERRATLESRIKALQTELADL
jgi:hypothetical protein